MLFEDSFHLQALKLSQHLYRGAGSSFESVFQEAVGKGDQAGQIVLAGSMRN